MSKGIIMAAIIGGAILLAAGAMIYFSPYQTCVRAVVGQYTYGDHGPLIAERGAQEICAVRRISN